MEVLFFQMEILFFRRHILINFIGRSITDDSRFRVEFLNNNAPTGFFFDFDVTMQKNFQTGNTH